MCFQDVSKEAVERLLEVIKKAGWDDPYEFLGEHQNGSCTTGYDNNGSTGFEILENGVDLGLELSRQRRETGNNLKILSIKDEDAEDISLFFIAENEKTLLIQLEKLLLEETTVALRAPAPAIALNYDITTDWCATCGAEHDYMNGPCEKCGSKVFTRNNGPFQRTREEVLESCNELMMSIEDFTGPGIAKNLMPFIRNTVPERQGSAMDMLTLTMYEMDQLLRLETALKSKKGTPL